jgi:hypothetical protein
VIPEGAAILASLKIVTLPPVVILPIDDVGGDPIPLSLPAVVNQSAPSGPVVIPVGLDNDVATIVIVALGAAPSAPLIADTSKARPALTNSTEHRIATLATTLLQ